MTDTKQFTEKNDVLKQFMELLNQQNMGEQSQDFMELFKYAAGMQLGIKGALLCGTQAGFFVAFFTMLISLSIRADDLADWCNMLRIGSQFYKLVIKDCNTDPGKPVKIL